MMPAQDQIQSFIINHEEYRGAIVRLEHVYKDIVSKHAYPPHVSIFLGEALAAIALLGQNLKQPGKLALQMESNGLIKLMIVEMNDKKQLRGLVQWNDEEISHDTIDPSGKLAITLMPLAGERYQGIVPLVGNSLAKSLEQYYNQSEQVDTRIYLCADDKHAAGMLIQRLPQKNHHEMQLDSTTLNFIFDTITQEELLQDTNKTILHKLLHEHQVHIFEPQHLAFKCQCSHEKMVNAVRMLGREDAMDLLRTHHIVEVTCDFCNHHYGFDRVEIEKIFRDEH